ncbi:TetR/AcrR family transcriptional regulator [Nesterenkonia sphaerica]|uniref:TetR/AcrR family transcriptional regulator n=1 Tax=Nesterenkonia sphaerica TaxID=1804988 RepID=A0A5R9AGC4_9MICC|nr:TetR/AcrR family transcriptional regulator [Nesterenkonia sphaerica]TLP76876.1 TetR/AcrR family transcriptional regulator [Nesterenkonia sphaerica]
MALTAGQIVEAAHGLVTRYGVQDVSMRRVAGELGVRPGALYYHVPNKQEMLRRVARRVLEPLHEVTDEPLALLQRLRQLVLALPDGGDLILIAYSLDPELPPVPALRSGLLLHSCTPAEAEETAAILMRYALGALAVEQNSLLFGQSDPAASVRYERGLLALLAGVRNTVSSP